MLQIANHDMGDAPPQVRPADLTVEDIRWFVMRYATILAAATMVTILAGALYVVTRKPTFTASAQLLIDPKPTLLLREQASDGPMALDTPQVESQIAVIKSERLLDKVAGKLEAELAASEPPPSFSLWSYLVGLLSRSPSEPPDPARKRQGVIAALQGDLDVRRIGLSHVLEISFRSHDRNLAASVANAVADAFVRDQLDIRAEAARKGGEWLEERIDELRRQMNAAALAVQEFKAKRDYRLAGRSPEPTAADKPPAKGEPGNARGGFTTLEELETQAYSYRKIYESYLQAHTDALQRQSYPIAAGRIIANASAPSRKSHPRTVLSLAIAGGIGLIAGLGIIVGLHSLDSSIRSPRHLRRVLGVECLAEIERRNRGDWVGRMLWWWPALAQRISPQPPETASAPLVGALLLHGRVRGLKSIGVVSAHRGEGRSTIAAELADCFHQSGQRTLLIDADPDHPALTRKLGGVDRPGLVDVLRQHAKASDVIIPAREGSPALLPVGRTAGTSRLNAAVSPEQAASFIGEAQKTYDRIVVDLPALGRDADGTALAAQLTACLLVVEAEATPQEAIEHAMQQMAATDVQVAGVVLNKTWPRTGP